MRSISQLVRSHPLFSYFILAYAFAWILYPLILISPVYGVPGLFAPALAAVVVSAVLGGRSEVGRLLRKLAIWRVDFIWYIVALGLPALLSFMVAVAGRFFGGEAVLELSPITPLGVVIFILVVGEEIGWRGFAQPRLETDRSPLIAALILGVLWGIWHLPNFFVAGLPHHEIPLAAFVIYTSGLSVLAAWLLKQTQGSVLIATLLHGATNTFGFLTPGLPTATRWWLTAAAYTAAGLSVAIFYGARLHRSLEVKGAKESRSLFTPEP